jgi:hypothetical protein
VPHVAMSHHAYRLVLSLLIYFPAYSLSGHT